MNRPSIHYRVDLTGIGHEVRVTATLQDPTPRDGVVSLRLPRWAPGSYLIREFARHVDWIRASQGGRDVSLRKSGADEWTASGVDPAPLVLTYGLHAAELSVRTNYFGRDRAVLSGPATFLAPQGGCRGPFAVEIVQPADWPEPLCALPREGGAFVAPDYDALLDAPIAAGPHREAEFDVHGVPHRVAVYGDAEVDVPALARDTKAACEAAAAIFGEVPCAQYLFIIAIGCSGGLEHADSTVCGFPPFPFATEAERRRNMSLLAHEYFHLWNVKRIRPQVLGPFDYRREALTPHLWAAEGLTSYYQHAIVLRANLISPERYLTILASHVLELESTPGRLHQSMEESSLDAWIKFYRPHENSPNSSISYYGKGAVVGLVLDLEIRRRTGASRSLDDAFRWLWALWKERPSRGYSDEELRAALSHAADGSLDDVVDECVLAPGELDVDSRLRGAGLELVRRPPRSTGGWIGAALKRADGGRTIVERVVREGPAWMAGLTAGDEIIAFDGYRVDDAETRVFLDGRRPGDMVTATAARWGRLRETRVELGSRPSVDYRIRKAPDATDDERRVAEAWLSCRWDDLRPLDEPPEDHRSGRIQRVV